MILQNDLVFGLAAMGGVLSVFILAPTIVLVLGIVIGTVAPKQLDRSSHLDHIFRLWKVATLFLCVGFFGLGLLLMVGSEAESISLILSPMQQVFAYVFLLICLFLLTVYHQAELRPRLALFIKSIGARDTLAKPSDMTLLKKGT